MPQSNTTDIIDLDNIEWPSCIRCGSEETGVIPKTGEWSCDDCGCQWTKSETPVDDGDTEKVSKAIDWMVRDLGDQNDEF